MNTKSLQTLVVVIGLLCSSTGLAAAENAKPNIVLIFIDDMGYGDIGPFGNKINKTPHLDQMAREGNVMRQFYVANTNCTPSRAALLTGTYAHRIGMDGDVLFPGEERGLNPEETTIAEILKANGYATGCFGKWHLGDQPEFLPLAQGFDEYFGIPYSNDMWPGNPKGHRHFKTPYTPLPVLHQNKVVSWVSDGPDQSLLCEATTDYAVKFIEDHQNEPFFCYVPHAYTHRPRYARPDLLEKSEGSVIRATIEEVDTSVGRILDKLRELKLGDNTLVIFTSDNGPATGSSAGRLRGRKSGPKYEGHMRMPTITWWPGKIPGGSVTRGIGVTTDILPSLTKLAGADLPSANRIDGKDILDLLLGKPDTVSPHKIHFYENEGIRRGKWKLVRLPSKHQLFDLSKDISEKNDVSESHPEIVEELNVLLDAHAAEIAANTRPAGFVKAGTAKPLLNEVGELPRLREFLNLKETSAIGEDTAKKTNRKKGGSSK
ncbi:MAG: sulfatase [Planctomycetota bacterium]